MAKKTSVATLLRRKITLSGRGSHVDEKTKLLLAANKGKVSSAAMEGLKLALFYTALPDKAALTPIPTPPPSPPKKSHGASSDLEESQTSNASTQRPPSTLSLPLLDSNYSLSPLPQRRSLPAPPSPCSLPSSPTTKVRPPRFGTPDVAVRSSDKDTSPCPYFSSESDSDGDEDILRRPRNRRSSKNRRLSAQQLASGMSSNRSSVSVSTFLSPNASPLHTSVRSSNRMTSKEEEKESRKQDNDSGATCSGCGDYLPFILKDEPTKTGSLGDNVPIYYVLERPSMCQSCLQGNHPDDTPLKKNKISVTSLPPALPPRDSSPLPPLPTLPLPYYSKESQSSSTDEDPVYETVISTSYKEEGENMREKDTKSRQLPPIAVNFSRDSREFHTSSDYESIPSIEASLAEPGQDENKSFLRGRNANVFRVPNDFGSSHTSCHDYESISSLDYGHKFTDLKSENVSVVHGYAKIPIKDGIEEADSPHKLSGDPSSIGQKSKLMKIDSHGYASVMSPGGDEASWEVDDLEQGDNRSDVVQPSTKGHRARDIEEAWKHQQERGYAALTLKTHLPTPPTLLRTSSDGILCNSLSLVAPGSSPCDYEVPIPRHPPPPPLCITKRKTSSPQMKHGATFFPTEEHQTFIRSEEAALEPISKTTLNSSGKESDKQNKRKDDDGVDPNFLDMEKDHQENKHSTAQTSELAPSHENTVPHTGQ